MICHTVQTLQQQRRSRPHARPAASRHRSRLPAVRLPHACVPGPLRHPSRRWLGPSPHTSTRLPHKQQVLAQNLVTHTTLPARARRPRVPAVPPASLCAHPASASLKPVGFFPLPVCGLAVVPSASTHEARSQVTEQQGAPAVEPRAACVEDKPQASIPRLRITPKTRDKNCNLKKCLKWLETPRRRLHTDFSPHVFSALFLNVCNTYRVSHRGFQMFSSTIFWKMFSSKICELSEENLAFSHFLPSGLLFTHISPGLSLRFCHQHVRRKLCDGPRGVGPRNTSSR